MTLTVGELIKELSHFPKNAGVMIDTFDEFRKTTKVLTRAMWVNGMPVGRYVIIEAESYEKQK